MAPFTSWSANPAALNRTMRKHPSLFGVPFVLLMVAASFGMQSFTQVRYDLHDKKQHQLTQEEALGLKKDRKKFDIREEYFKLNAARESDVDWDNKRIPRPPGVPEWGVAPPEERFRDSK